MSPDERPRDCGREPDRLAGHGPDIIGAGAINCESGFATVTIRHDLDSPYLGLGDGDCSLETCAPLAHAARRCSIDRGTSLVIGRSSLRP